MVGGRPRGFTLTELLVVIAIIGLLATIMIPVMGVVYEKTRKARAQKEIKELASAATQYYYDHHAYPPDTDDWGSKGGNEDVWDEYCLHRYLGREIVRREEDVDESEWKSFGPYLEILPQTLVYDSGGDVGKYCDPWKTPYQFDAYHMKDGVMRGWPYPKALVQKSLGSGVGADEAAQKLVRDFKVVSYGTDGKPDVAYPFDWETKAKDDIRSR
jgi:prepilin-type N-terminal cleavage/methylation domain-containing protein